MTRILYIVLSLLLCGSLYGQLTSSDSLKRMWNLAHYKLCEELKNEKLMRAYRIILNKCPDFYSDMQLQKLLASACQSVKKPYNGTSVREIEEARSELTRIGKIDYIRHKTLRRAVYYYCCKWRMLKRMRKIEKESTELRKIARIKAMELAASRACQANLKTLSGAIQMFDMDNNSQVSAIDEKFMERLVKDGYLRNAVSCPEDKSSYVMDEKEVLRCPLHGSAEEIQAKYGSDWKKHPRTPIREQARKNILLMSEETIIFPGWELETSARP